MRVDREMYRLRVREREGKRHTFCPPAKQFLPTKKLHFRSDADNTVVYSNLLINIPQCGIRENTYNVTVYCEVCSVHSVVLASSPAVLHYNLCLRSAQFGV